MTTTDPIHVALLNEAVDCWRPVPAEPANDGAYTILATPDYDPADEAWQFPPGSQVVCERRQLAGGGTALVAVRLHEPVPA